MVIVIRYFAAPTIGLSLGLFALSANALAPIEHSVRTANYFLKAGTDIQPSMFDKLAAYDVLILPMEAAVYNKDFFEFARKKNPDIAILAYVPSRSINIKDIDDGAGIRKKLKDGIQHDWYLRDASGVPVTAWPQTLPINITSEWREYLPRFVHDTIMATHLWDGIFYDEVDDGISFLNGGNIDLNGDGRRESNVELNAAWKTAMTYMLSRTRELIGSDALLVINGSSAPEYQPYVNGRMYESFPTPWEGRGFWTDSMESYLTLSKSVSNSSLFIINADSSNTGRDDIFQKVRFGLVSTLLGNGFFGFDYGTENHGQLWWYDEYGVHLGKPAGDAYPLIHYTGSGIASGVWRRDFQQGTAIVNSSNTLENINLEGEFEKIRGTQDPLINDGSIVSSVSIPPTDGILLLRPLSSLFNAAFNNGSFARVFDAKGMAKRNGFFAYDSSQRGSATIIMPIHSPVFSRIIADHGLVQVENANGENFSFRPFERWSGELNLALDMTNSESPLIYISKESSQIDSPSEKKDKPVPSSIAVFTMRGILLNTLYPLGKNYTGYLHFALGDLNADGIPELVVSTGPQTEPIIRIYDRHGRLLSGGFLAYQRSFRGGVYVAVADIDGTGYGRIICAPGSTGSPLIRIFDSKARPLSPGFLAFSNANKGGVRVIASDIDGDGKDEIVATTTKVFTYALQH